MTKIRVRFSKSNALSYIGHLDFLKVFQQTIRRANLPMAYSQGFNPHMLLSFALPLPLGMASKNDYADLTLASTMPTNDIVSQLNTYAPSGLKLTGAWEVEGAGAAALAAVADYSLIMPKSNTEGIETLLGQQSIVVPKKTKSGIKNTDIRTDILDIWETTDITVDKAQPNQAINQQHLQQNKSEPHESEPQQHEATVIMRLSAGSARFINPLIVAKLLLKHDTDPKAITRLDLYYQTKEKELIPLHEATTY